MLSNFHSPSDYKILLVTFTVHVTLYSPWNSPGQNTGAGSLSLHQAIFPTQGIEPRSPTLQVDSLPAELQGKPL